MSTLTIDRAELVQIVREATASVLTPSTREKLIAVAETTDAVAVGWFHCDGVQCPASQARRRHQSFQMAYDAAMCARFGFNPDEVAVDPFVVRVTPEQEDRNDG